MIHVVYQKNDGRYLKFVNVEHKRHARQVIIQLLDPANALSTASTNPGIEELA
jgi:hypothetical protein